MNEQFNESTALLGHTDEQSAYLVDDYPYGFRLRTQIRYWIETTKHGDRMVSQTLNPKTDRWNKPKKSTYCYVGCLYLDEQGHVTWTGLNVWAEPAVIDRFCEVMGDELTKAQALKVAELRGMNKAMEGVTCEVVVNPTPKQMADIKRNAARVAHHLAVSTFQAKQEVDESFGTLDDWKREQRHHGFKV